MKRTKKMISMVLSAVLLLSLCLGGTALAADGDEELGYYTLTYSSQNSPGGVEAQVEEYWMQLVTEATDGHITFDTYWASTMLSERDCFVGVKNGVVDCAFASSSVITADIPRNALLTTMFTNLGNTKTFYENVMMPYMEKYPDVQEELYGVEICDVFLAPVDGAIHSTEGAGLIKTPDDMKGAVVSCPTDFITTWFSACGGSPIQLEVTEWYSSFQTGLADAMWMIWGPIKDLNLGEVLTNHSMLSNVAVGYTIAYIFINADTFASLPEAYQEILTSFNEEVQEKYEEINGATIAEVQASIEEAGGTVYTMTDEETAQWVELAEGAVDEQITIYSDTYGFDAAEYLATINELGEANQ